MKAEDKGGREVLSYVCLLRVPEAEVSNEYRWLAHRNDTVELNILGSLEVNSARECDIECNIFH